MRPGHLVMLCALALLCFGVVMVQSAGLSVGSDRDAITGASILMARPTVYFLLAILALAAASWIPMDRLMRANTPALSPAWVIPIAMGLCLLVYVPGLSRQVNGAHRWIGFTAPGVGQVSFQPSEVAKWGSVVFTAWFAVWNAARMHRFVMGLAVGLAPVGILAALVLLEDLGTAALIGAVAVLMLLAGGARLGHVASLAPAGLFVIAVGVLAEPYRVRRITAFLDPFADPSGSGYHAIQSLAAVAGGEGFGRGLGFGLQKFGYLPEDQTDFIFAIVCEELGVAGATLLIGLYIALLWSGWAIVVRERARAMRLLGLGVLLTIGLQALINLVAVTGLGPTKGIALPLVSAGGTGWVLTAAALGLLVGMDRRHSKEDRAADAMDATRSPGETALRIA